MIRTAVLRDGNSNEIGSCHYMVAVSIPTIRLANRIKPKFMAPCYSRCPTSDSSLSSSSLLESVNSVPQSSEWSC